MELTSTHEDYLEIVYRRAGRDAANGIRVTDLAEDLGCRLPTVTRTVRFLAGLGVLRHEARGLVYLTPRGRTLASEIAHRHDDIVAFLEIVLGMPRSAAFRDACRIEHGISPMAAERLHWFMQYVESLHETEREMFRAAARGERGAKRGRRRGNPKRSFRHLIPVRAEGWRR